MQSNSPALSLIAEGRTAEVYAWDGAHVLKLYHDWCPSEWVEHEAYVARVIAQAGIPTPQVGEILERDGRRGILYERVEGVSMLVDMRRRPWLLVRHARSLADLQAQFHRLTVPGLQSYRDRLGRSIRQAPELPETLRKQALSILETLPAGNNLCHGDFHPDNVLVTRRGAMVIDWMTACLGSPWADVARTSMILSIGVKAAGKQVPAYLRWASDLFQRVYLDRYRSLAPGEQSELARWMPVIAAARLNEQIAPERNALIEIVKEGLTR